MSIDLRRAPIPADPVRTYYVFNAVLSLCTAIAFTLSAVYSVEVVRLDPFQLVLVGTVMEASCFVFEIPTGVIADLVSRRLSVLLGLLLMAGAFALLAAVPVLWAVLLAQAVWGLGYTCISGAADAWVTDEVGADRMGPVFQREQQVHLASTTVGVVAAGVLGTVSLRLPFLVAACGLVVLTVVLALVLDETRFAPPPPGDRGRAAQLGRSMLAGVRLAARNRTVRGILVVSLLAGAASEVFDRLWTVQVLAAHRLPPLLGRDDPALWFAGFSLVGTVLALVVSLLAGRRGFARLSGAHPGVVLASLTALRIGGMVVFALGAPLWVALSGLWARTAAIALAEPVEATWLNAHADGATRATVLSTNSQLDAIGQVAGGPPLGLLARSAGVPVALLAAAALLVPAAVIQLRLRDAGSGEGGGPHARPGSLAAGVPPESQHRTKPLLPDA
jgi:MFS family permease